MRLCGQSAEKLVKASWMRHERTDAPSRDLIFIDTNAFEADNIYKNPPPNMPFHPYLFAIFISLWASTHDSADCWSAHRSPAVRDSFKRVHDRCKVGDVGLVAPQTKILAKPSRVVC